MEYAYDHAGRMQTMKTWQDFAGGSGAATTTWNYSTNCGFLIQKLYADSQGPSYTFTPGGRRQSRTWARGITTTNTYNYAGEIQLVDYSDSTADVSYAYDRMGRPKDIRGMATNTLAYTLYGQLVSEDMVAGQFNYLSQSRYGYDSALRMTAFTNLTLGTANQFGYVGSRLASVTNGIHRVAYTYLANSPLLQDTVFRRNGANVMTTARQYDYLNRLQSISSSGTGILPVSFNYGYNAANQRVAVTNADNSRWVYQYDSLGQVTSGKKYWSDGTPVAGQQFEYGFDDIGNRNSSKTGGDASGTNLRIASYTANALNQYTNRTVPSYVEVNGSAATNVTMTVNGFSPLRQNSYFREELVVNNTNGAIVLSITNIATDTTSTSLVARTAFVPQTPESYQHDADGNLIQDGRWKYTWDGENRLTRMESLTNSLPSDQWQRLDFAYDAQGRRLRKQVWRWNASALNFQLSSNRRFLYQGWNLMGEVDEVSGARLSYTWGQDLSGSMQGAGGVGGLLFITQHATNQLSTYLCAYDGNGNVTGLIDATTGTTSGQFEYGPFGETIRATGVAAKVNPFRFSTKYQDDETDLLYYGYRYYNPSSGRWLSRDPIAERGGKNLYGFLGNNPMSRTDRLGLDGNPVSGPRGPVGPSDPYSPGGVYWVPPLSSFPGPGPGDGINIFGFRGRKGVENYFAWFERRFPNSIEGAKDLLAKRIRDKACAQMGSRPTTLPDLIDKADDVDFKANTPRPDIQSDKPQNWWERNIRLGSFQVKADNVRLQWKNGCCFTYSATVFVEEHTGADWPWESDYNSSGEDILAPTFLFVSRDVRMAEWKISGEHCCPFELLSVPK